MTKTILKVMAICATLLSIGTAQAAGTPAQQCQASKNKAVGKYVACRENAEAKLASTGDTAKYDETITKCENKYQAAWQKAEEKAADAGSSCTTTGDQAAVQDVTDEYTDNVAQHLGGAPLGDCPGDLTSCSTDLGTCNTNYSSCSGSLATCNAGTATAADVLSGKTFSSSAGLGVSGSAVAGSNVSGGNGLKTFTIPDGLYSGSKTATANDANLAAANIKSGVSILGVTGVFLPPTCGNGLIDGTEQCDLGTLNSQTCVSQGFTGGTLRCGAGCVFDTSACYAARYVDNSNGAITDNQTGLMWEKKVKKDGTVDLANLQDADNTYRWANRCSVTTAKYCQPNTAASTACLAGVEGDTTGCAECTGGEGTCTYYSGVTTIWEWLVALNAANFATHSDWRLAKTTELEGLVDYADTSAPAINVAFHGASCGGSCTDITSPACACTQSNYYWSASTYAPTTNNAWLVYFSAGFVFNGTKTLDYYVRAVRGGL